ncbi:hypothetical protein [Mycobacteroides abscessus]|nr:hypothetical protein [Mycobacteroides abscessus]UEA49533.1 hypothetical protein LK451_04995 [Mycobacteroides abscessus subsp. abscessus]CPR68964.1 Uncharacterised protein [Mycobacteroides abscessus]CPS36787.1 Uncharacterised protein [Mycobacteroides abscessus]CPY32461.1 Uncharacterised protein [Mycobacteroides abscessus]CPY43832.1 Uncharacterised protein [Mycobacteroides abscessus]
MLADMMLLERRQLPDKPSSVYQRRGLWEAAVIAYSRADQSQYERPVPFKQFVKDIAGEQGAATHDRIMDWRHGHVAHRNKAEFETVDTLVKYENGVPVGLYVAVASDIGPANNNPFVGEVEQHVELIRNAVYERKMSPLAIQLVPVLFSDQVTLNTPGPAIDRSSDERLVLTHDLAKIHVHRSS